jgi:hypothetical protein
MAISRLEKIRRVRSVSDLLDIIKEIKADFSSNEKVVNNIISSLSGDEEIVFDRPAQTRKSARVVKFVAPKQAELQKHLTVITSLYNNVTELDAAEAMIKQSFAGNRKAADALKAIKALREEIDDKVNDAFDALSEIAEKHLPEDVQDFGDKLERHLIKSIDPSTFGDMTKSYYVSLGDVKGEIQFATYLGLHDLKDTKGYTHESFYIVLTSVLNKAGVLQFYVNAFPEFKLPGSYPVGREVTNDNAMKMRVDMLMAHNNFKTEHEKLAFPVSDKRAKGLGVTSLKGVESVAVVDDEMVLSLMPNTTQKQQVDIASAVIARLRSVVGASQGISFKYRLGRANNKPALKFILTPNDERGRINTDIRINTSKLEEIKHALNLNDSQVKALRFALQS